MMEIIEDIMKKGVVNIVNGLGIEEGKKME